MASVHSKGSHPRQERTLSRKNGLVSGKGSMSSKSVARRIAGQAAAMERRTRRQSGRKEGG